MTEPAQWTIAASPRNKAVGILFAFLIILGALSLGDRISDWLVNRLADSGIYIGGPPAPVIPIAVVPGPPRTKQLDYTLTPDNSIAMTGHNDLANERWADIAGNYYAPSFIQSFSYTATGPAAPSVRLHVDTTGATVKGRIEAKGLKPNFAYQIKLQGDYERDSRAIVWIGGLGRWRLPGKETNYTDADFINYPNKAEVESYLIFDYFVTDKDGNAVRDLELGDSLHVLWNPVRQTPPRGLTMDDVLAYMVDATSPQLYARPKPSPTKEGIWAERERIRYEQPNSRVVPPNGTFKCNLALTEESFHSTAADGGWWATVYTAPIEFTIAR